ncbi:MAG: hypothetical protein RL226_969 [Bacteroidota bacterium]|jgi:hypothetical protein
MIRWLVAKLLNALGLARDLCLEETLSTRFCYLRRMKHAIYVLLPLALLGCKKEKEDTNTATTDQPSIIFTFRFDEDQARLDNFGNPSVIPAGHAAQTPEFHGISANYIELTPNGFTPLGGGEIIYDGPQTTEGGESAIDFDLARIVAEDEMFVKMPLSAMEPGTYMFARVSLSYQNYEIDFLASGLNLQGRIASFVGFNNYISSYTIDQQTVEVNANKLQGYWGFETLGQVITGQAPAGATTVVNPLWNTSPIPAGSCIVTGQFAEPLTITGNETEDVVVVLSLSVNNSFEWIDDNGNGLYEPNAGEQVVDMGVRGLIPIAQ